jgi:hypothetical protein
MDRIMSTLSNNGIKHALQVQHHYLALSIFFLAGHTHAYQLSVFNIIHCCCNLLSHILIYNSLIWITVYGKILIIANIFRDFLCQSFMTLNSSTQKSWRHYLKSRSNYYSSQIIVLHITCTTTDPIPVYYSLGTTLAVQNLFTSRAVKICLK